MKGKHAFSKNNNVDIDWLHIRHAIFVSVKSPDGDEIVI